MVMRIPKGPSASRVFRAVPLIGLLAIMGCGPGQDVRSSSGESAPTPIQTVVFISRVEPNSLSAHRIVDTPGISDDTNRPFNASLITQDHSGKPVPYLAATVPQLNTETWRVFPDGRMETTYQLRPGLIWHDGQPLDPED